MTGPAKLRQLAGQVHYPEVAQELRAAADEIVRLRGELKRWEFAVELLTRQRDAEVEAVELLREWRVRSRADLERVLSMAGLSGDENDNQDDKAGK